ncbi:hypothetical protein Sala_0755 [Sphingopyxis alaskensis RB2256]|jgi:hypothetical protein|uniref:Uncharacterized protein n=2 Tax=Sphingopyxis alaskensis TaxID=117207 RepID=Q1GV47_SPHAL|nr:hypothetical protein Sala_0755 [Sphingopyxis alaskensis RB2256]
MRGWIVVLAAAAGSASAMAQSAIKLPIASGFWTNDDQQCATARYGYIFDGRRWGSVYYYGPTGNLGPAAELQAITQTRAVGGGFTQMQFGGFDGAGYFRIKATGTDRALYRVGAPFRDEIQVADERLIRCSYQAMSPKMKAAMRRFAPALARVRTH